MLQQFADMYYRQPMMYERGSGTGWVEAVFLFGFLALLSIVAYVLLKLAISRSQGNIDARQTPLDIAKERFARGEITSEELDAIRKTLKS